MQSASATPIRNRTPWSVLLCKSSDRPAEPRTPAFFASFLTPAGAGTGGAADYFTDQSGGRVSLAGSVVRGWFTESHTFADNQATNRWTRIQWCVDAAAAGGYTVPAGHRVVAIVNEGTDSGSDGSRVLLDQGAWNVGFAAHEMLHGYGLGHSFSNDTTYQNAPWSQPGEYDDPWDEMSAMHIHATSGTYGTNAVGLNAYHRDELGWLPRNRVLTLGADGIASRTIRLAPLEVPAASGPQLVRIPFDPGDLFRAYTVEFRRRTGWSAGIPNDTVLIHESLNANGVRITIGTVVGNAATITVSTEMVDRCLVGYVWREARPSDHVCVSGATRSQVAADNATAASRWVNGP